MTAAEFRTMADRCRELQRIAVRDEIREQLRQWADEFDTEAEAIEKVASYIATIGAKDDA
jgi:hypothetical protein